MKRPDGTPGTVTFTVPGESAPQGSKRHVGNGRMIESSARVKPWRAQVAWAAKGIEATFSDPVGVTAIIGIRRPPSHYTPSGNLRSTAPAHPTYRNAGDLDKHLRSLLDGLVEGGIITDDSLVCTVFATKSYVRDDPTTIVTITRL